MLTSIGCFAESFGFRAPEELRKQELKQALETRSMALWHWLLTFHLGRAEWPLPAEQHELHGVQTFVHWPGRVEAVLLLFHGCNNQGSDWFQKPEEVIFLREATSRANALIAFTTPRHRGNFCWPNADGDSDDFETSVTMIYRATAALLQMKAKPNGKKPTLVLVGASSGGVFARRTQTLVV